MECWNWSRGTRCLLFIHWDISQNTISGLKVSDAPHDDDLFDSLNCFLQIIQIFSLCRIIFISLTWTWWHHPAKVMSNCFYVFHVASDNVGSPKHTAGAEWCCGGWRHGEHVKYSLLPTQGQVAHQTILF
jgi:hypothetical protein